LLFQADVFQKLSVTGLSAETVEVGIVLHQAGQLGTAGKDGTFQQIEGGIKFSQFGGEMEPAREWLKAFSIVASRPSIDASIRYFK
jgi:hypothetical protein